MTPLRRKLRRRLRRLGESRQLAPIAWRVRARRRARVRALDPRPRPLLYERRARIATPPEIRALERELRAVAAGSGRVVFAHSACSLEEELLYWIPFLTWIVDELGLDAGRCTALVHPGAARWYANVAATVADEAPADTTAVLDQTHLERLCAAYWAGVGPIVHVLDRLRFRRLPRSAHRPRGIALWRGESPVPALEPLWDAKKLRLDDLGALTATIRSAALLVGSADGPIHLGPIFGTPTLAMADQPSAHLDLAQRAAYAYDTPFVLVDAETLPLTVTLAEAAHSAALETSS